MKTYTMLVVAWYSDVMNSFEIENKLNELKDCEIITIKIKGKPYLSLPTNSIINIPTEECLLLETEYPYNKYHYSDIISIEQTP